jgi:hypothetical protein
MTVICFAVMFVLAFWFAVRGVLYVFIGLMDAREARTKALTSLTAAGQ